MAHFTAIDPTFNAAPLPAGTGSTNVATVAVQADGKVVEAILSFNFATNANELTIARLNTDGSLDNTFGTNGKVFIPAGGPGSGGSFVYGPHNLAIQPDGSIGLATVIAVPQPGTFSTEVTLAVQLTPTGQLDPAFGTNGEVAVATTAIGFGNATVAAQPDNKLLVLTDNNVTFDGTSVVNTHNLILARYNTDGTLDTSFNGSGAVAITYPANPTVDYLAIDLAVDSTSGRIFVGANAGSATLVQLNSDGTYVTSFGTGGILTVTPPTGSNYAYLSGLAIQDDGSVVLVGTTSKFVGFNVVSTGFLMRILPDGTADAPFAAATGGSTAFSRLLVNSLAISDDGTITVGGTYLTAGGSATIGIARFLATGAADAGFGFAGRLILPVTGVSTNMGTAANLNGLDLTPTGEIMVSGVSYGSVAGQNILVRLLPVRLSLKSDDYDGDGVSDISALVTGPALYAYRPSAGGSDVLTTYGAAGVGNSIPTPGDYDGDGKTDLAVYLPETGQLIYRPSRFNLGDVKVSFDTSNTGFIPAVGDYDGDGLTDPAVYDPATGSFLVRNSTTGLIQTTQFGVAGPDASIPAPGDYDGDGKTDLAVYLPQLGIYAYRPSFAGDTTSDVLASFGLPGDRMTIPAPGDYDGDGRTDIAVYLPSLAYFGYRPSSIRGTSSDVLRSFGLAGEGATIPAPGDYDGDGTTDLAAYIPQYALYAYRPSSAVVASSDVWTSFGVPGVGATVPVASIPYAQPALVLRMALSASPGDEVGVPIALTEDVLAELAGLGRKKKA